MFCVVSLDVLHVRSLTPSFSLPLCLGHVLRPTQIVDSTVFLNPSFLTKASQEASAGTFARLTIHPMDRENLNELAQSGLVDVGGEPDEPVEHRVWERCRVDIIKV